MQFNDLPLPVLKAIEASHDPAVLLNQVKEAMVYMDANWVVQYCNDAYLNDVGRPRDEVIGHTPFDFIPNFARSIFYDLIETAKREKRLLASVGFSTVLNRWLLVRCFPLPCGGGLMLANDATEGIVKHHELAQQALKDGLTSLPNKLALHQDLARLLEAKASFHLTMFGLNRFAQVNDTVGFAKGDQVMMQVASHIQSGTEDGERLYRLTGDEFVLVSTRDPASRAYRAKMLQAHASKPVTLGSQSFVLGACAGLVIGLHDGADVDVLLKRATLALREAKRSGRDELREYEPKLEAASRNRLILEGELREAVSQGKLALHLQPKCDLLTMTTVGAEALIRWPHETRGTISPADFLPLAQECDLMRELDRWVIDRALQHVADLRRGGRDIPVSINLSVDSLSDPQLADNVRVALERNGVPAALLEIEIPEGALMRDVEVSGRILTALHELGVTLSIDDFGTGYSSFAYLTRFPVQTLKIDRSFIAEMAGHEPSRKVVRGIVRLAHSLGMRVVAEGTETDHQIDALKQMRCDEIQGWGYARPMPYADFERSVLTGPRAAISAMSI